MSAQTLLEDRTFRFQNTNRNQDGQYGLLRVGVNQYQRVQLSWQSQPTGEWCNAEFPLGEWRMFLNHVKNIAQNQPGDDWTVQCTKRNKETKQQDITAVVKVSRNQDGIVVISCAAPGSQAEEFLIKPAYQYVYTKGGEKVAPSELSRQRALAWVEDVGEITRELLKGTGNAFTANQGNGKNKWQGKPKWQNNAGAQQQWQAAPVPSQDFSSYASL